MTSHDLEDQDDASMPRSPDLGKMSFDEGPGIIEEDDDDFYLPFLACHQPVHPVQAAFERDIQDAQRSTNEWQCIEKTESIARKDEFAADRYREWSQTTAEGRNFLHCLAYHCQPSKPFVNLQWLMARAISRWPQLMGSLDNTHRTPLMVALCQKNDLFIFAACKSQKKDTLEQFRSALISECDPEQEKGKKATCLHVALRYNFQNEDLKEQIIKIMCAFVPDKMFTVTDFRGYTPLHVAIEYERCHSDTQVRIVQELLARGPQALDISIVFGGKRCSLYQFHRRSRCLFESRERARALERKLPGATALTGWRGMEAPKPVKRRGSDEMPKKGKKMIITLQHDFKNRLPNLCSGPKRRKLDSSPTGLYEPVPGQDSVPKQCLPSTDRERQKAEPDDLEDKMHAARLIDDHLKMAYLRSKPPHLASALLHITEDSRREFWFDFGPPRPLRQKGFKKHFDHLHFNTCLQYVALPRLQLSEDKDPPTPRARGRQDLVFLFDWLGKKGVTHIIKIIVDDLEIPSHTDEAVEQCLRSFQVEILDWRRLDLDPVSLQTVGGCLREVYLYWSGRNPVLRAWSEQDGLAKIPTLELIHVIQVENPESIERTQVNFKTFEDRIREFWASEKKPRIELSSFASARLQTLNKAVESRLHGPRQQLADPHRWIQCMEQFSEIFRQLRALQTTTETASKLGPVKIALIDDGVDIMHEDLRGAKIFGKSFHQYEEAATRRVAPYWDSSSGHGTVMARLIRRICPSAMIYIIKVQTFFGEGSQNLQIDPDSARQAIDHALEQDVQIISMSWTTKPPPPPPTPPLVASDKGFALDSTRLDVPTRRDVLMFCAASDQGQREDQTYPHSSHPHSLRIGAAKATGTMLDGVGSPHDLDFILPGHKVVIDRHKEDALHAATKDMEISHTGSSVATALAAGLAALIIECVRLGVLYTEEADPKPGSTCNINKDDWNKILRRQDMIEAFSAIGTSPITKNQYIEVWRTFDGVLAKLRDVKGRRVPELEVIANLAGVLLKKGVR